MNKCCGTCKWWDNEGASDLRKCLYICVLPDSLGSFVEYHKNLMKLGNGMFCPCYEERNA